MIPILVCLSPWGAEAEMFSSLWADLPPPLPLVGAESVGGSLVGAAVVEETARANARGQGRAGGPRTPRGGGRGRARGFRLSDLTKVRMSLAKPKRRAASAQCPNQLFVNALAPARALDASRTTFGGTELKQGELVIIDGQVAEMKRACSGHCHKAVVRDFGLASHVRAQPRCAPAAGDQPAKWSML